MLWSNNELSCVKDSKKITFEWFDCLKKFMIKLYLSQER